MKPFHMALFAAAEDWVRSKGMHSIHGPLGFTDLDQEGMLIEGFDQLGTMATIYNHAYYPVHAEKAGYWRMPTGWSTGSPCLIPCRKGSRRSRRSC